MDKIYFYVKDLFELKYQLRTYQQKRKSKN